MRGFNMAKITLNTWLNTATGYTETVTMNSRADKRLRDIAECELLHQEERERPEVAVQKPSVIYARSHGEMEGVFFAWDTPRDDCTAFVELPTGYKVISKEDLAKAWYSSQPNPLPYKLTYQNKDFLDLCKALGFTEGDS